VSSRLEEVFRLDQEHTDLYAWTVGMSLPISAGWLE
jgi:hypothetical protein